MIRIFAVAALAFAALRTGLFLAYRDHFADASLWRALATGLRFDAQLITLACAPFLLVLLLPVPRWQTAKLRRFCAWACGAVLAVLFGAAYADAVYFGEVNRHLGGELFNIGNDLGEILQTAGQSRLTATLGGTAALLGLAWAWRRWVAGAARDCSGSLKKLISINLLTLLLLAFLGRGMVLQGKPLSAIDAFDGTGQAQANLALNGALLSIKAWKDRNNIKPLHYLDEAQMRGFAAHNPQPFLYRPQGKPSGKNIVFILLESWSYHYIDALAGKNYGVTPNMDALARQSQVWDNFYAAGQRSIIGIQAALTSVPALPEREPLGFGLELNRISRIAELAGAQGYRTIMAQSSKRRSFHMDGIAKALGFQEYYGQEDVPVLRDYGQGVPAFGWDYDTLMFLHKKLNEQPQRPFFAFLFTGTTHEPFADVGAEFRAYPHDAKGENGFLNTLKYSDWAVGEFMKHAQKQSWYNNTLFVFAADHTLNSAVRHENVRERFHIPLIIFDPSDPQPVRHARESSHYDLLPTFADILGIRQPVYTFGSSLLRPDAPILPLMLNQGESTAMLHDGETAEFQGKQLISGTPSPALELLQARMQSADGKLRENRWAE
ncbi:LTA synthase family protein [Conchiformibius kuhniae]|uniref:LTA synthase family protein n=1 Tax=Conchiformibius kuhniae TaxID=211502 RepID=A0A8T9MRJ8_9NEIS